MRNDGSNKSLTIPVSPLLREALSARETGEDFDEALLRTLKAQYPGEAAALLAAVTRLVEVETERTKESKEQILQRLAEAAPGPEITLNFGGEGNISKIRAESKTYRVGDRVYHSLEEMPPDLRRLVERELGPSRESNRGGKTLRVGCPFSLFSALLVGLARIFGK
jgi:hypothetical protein